jgi:hypothetical protein
MAFVREMVDWLVVHTRRLGWVFRSFARRSMSSGTYIEVALMLAYGWLGGNMYMREVRGWMIVYDGCEYH